MADDKAAMCRRNSWIAAIAAGALVAVMLLAFAQFAFWKAVLIGLIFAGLLGAFLGWSFCTGTKAPADTARPAPVAPKPAPPVAPPAPKVDAAPEPDEQKTAPAKPAFLQGLSPAPLASTAEVKAESAKAQADAEDKPKPSAKAASGTGFGLDMALAKSKDDVKIDAPEMLDAPRGGQPDDLKLIKGIGPKLEALLNEVGVWHFDQIATWKAKDIAFVDEKLVGFRGRITRDEWVKQAKVLAKGGETEFAAKVKKGGVY